jgi:broad specificity phosphatase PhoE
LICVRHGRTEWNAARRFQGHIDVPLDLTGRSQARTLAGYLRDERFDAAYTSDLSRARQTAEAILEKRDLEPVVEPRFREMAFGDWEGLTWPQIVERHPELGDAYEASPKFYTPAGGESFDAVCERVGAALADLRAAHPPGARVLLVTHAGVIHALLRIFSGSDERALEVRLLPASITRFADDGDAVRLIGVNEVAADTIPHTPA